MTLLAASSIRPMWPEPERLGEIGIRLGSTLLVAFLLQRLLFLLVSRVEKFVVRAGHGSAQIEQRARTLSDIFRSLITVMVAGGAVIYGLSVLGWNVGPLLAGAGLLGVALGLGAQTLVRDIIAGVFILAEDQFAVGDLIEVNGKPATVETLTVRCTTLRDFNGYMHFVPNGEMKIVINRSRGWNRLAVDVPVAPDQELEPALEACGRAVDALNADPAWTSRLLEPAQLSGVETLGARGAQIRLVVRARPGADAPEAARRLRVLAHHEFSSAGIRIAAIPEISIRPMDEAEGSMPAAGMS